MEMRCNSSSLKFPHGNIVMVGMVSICLFVRIKYKKNRGVWF
jgi:hypothetical protein